MIISKRHAKKLIKEGKAKEISGIMSGYPGNLTVDYIAIDRYDIQRVDHYRV